jgi:CheY-like chemotaxis protein
MHEAPTSVRGSETVLLVEDHEALRELAGSVLRESGYRLLEAPDPETALRICAEHRGPIDLLVTDVVMPGSSGLELAERILRQRPEMAVLYMSGYSNDVAMRSGLVKTGAAFLEKPFTPSVLRRKVREVLDAATTLVHKEQRTSAGQG